MESDLQEQTEDTQQSRLLGKILSRVNFSWPSKFGCSSTYLALTPLVPSIFLLSTTTGSPVATGGAAGGNEVGGIELVSPGQLMLLWVPRSD